MKATRNTRQRHVILDELSRVTSHPTATELYDLVRRRIPNISLGTVYRNLDVLARRGTIQKLEFSGAETRFDGNPSRHDHLRCLRCGRVDDMPGTPLHVPTSAGNDFRGYTVLGHRLELIGICPECRAEPYDHQHDEREIGRC